MFSFIEFFTILNKIYSIVFDSLLTHLNSQEYNELNGLLAICCLSSLINNPGMPNKFKEVMKFNLNKKNEVSNIYFKYCLYIAM